MELANPGTGKGSCWARGDWTFFPFPPSPHPPPPGGREKQGPLPHQGGGRNKAPSPTRGEGETRPPPPPGGREKHAPLPLGGGGLGWGGELCPIQPCPAYVNAPQARGADVAPPAK